MRAEVTATVRQEQVQYQTSELPDRRDRPGLPRSPSARSSCASGSAGESKKGHNVLYGLRYARVILTHLVARARRLPRRPPAAARTGEPPRPDGPAARGGRRALPVLRVVGFVAALGDRRGDGRRRRARGSRARPELVAARARAGSPARVWWLLLARGWAVLLRGHVTRARRSALVPHAGAALPARRHLGARLARGAPSGGAAADRVATVAAENVLRCARRWRVGGARARRRPARSLWLPPSWPCSPRPRLAAALPARARRVGARAHGAGRRRPTSAAFVAYAVCAVLVQARRVGLRASRSRSPARPPSPGARGLVVIIAPGGVGVRELAYVGAAVGRPAATATGRRGASSCALVTIVAELAVLLLAGRPSAILRKGVVPYRVCQRRCRSAESSGKYIEHMVEANPCAFSFSAATASAAGRRRCTCRPAGTTSTSSTTSPAATPTSSSASQSLTPIQPTWTTRLAAWREVQRPRDRLPPRSTSPRTTTSCSALLRDDAARRRRALRRAAGRAVLDEERAPQALHGRQQRQRHAQPARGDRRGRARRPRRPPRHDGRLRLRHRRRGASPRATCASAWTPTTAARSSRRSSTRPTRAPSTT